MEVHQLRYAVAIADAGTFTAAARELGVAQSGVSAQVARLEHELGVTLFERRARGVAVTEAGAPVLERMRTALAALDDVGSAAAEVVGMLRGPVRVGAVAVLSWPPFLDALEQVRADHPGLDLSLREGISADLQASVADGRLDLAVVSWVDDPAPGLHAWVVLHEEVVALVAADHPWAGRRRIAPRELLDHDLVCTTRGTGMRAAFERLVRAEGVGARVRWEVTLPTTARALARRGLGAAIVTSSRADPPYDLVRVLISSRHTTSMLGVVWRSRPAPSAATTAALRAVRRHLGAIDDARADDEVG